MTQKPEKADLRRVAEELTLFKRNFEGGWPMGRPPTEVEVAEMSMTVVGLYLDFKKGRLTVAQVNQELDDFEAGFRPRERH